MGGFDIFISDGPTDRCFVDPDDIRHLRHSQRFELGNTLFKKIQLGFEDFSRDSFDCALALFNRIDEKFTGPHSFAQIIPLGFR